MISKLLLQFCFIASRSMFYGIKYSFIINSFVLEILKIILYF